MIQSNFIQNTTSLVDSSRFHLFSHSLVIVSFFISYFFLPSSCVKSPSPSSAELRSTSVNFSSSKRDSIIVRKRARAHIFLVCNAKIIAVNFAAHTFYFLSVEESAMQIANVDRKFDSCLTSKFALSTQLHRTPSAPLNLINIKKKSGKIPSWRRNENANFF